VLEQTRAQHGPPNLRTHLDVSRAMGRQGRWEASLKLLDEVTDERLAELPGMDQSVWLLRCTVHRIHALVALKQVLGAAEEREREREREGSL
jgi:hypothetical protein